MSQGPIHQYRALLRAGELNADPAQLRAVELLQTLHLRLDGYKPGAEKGGLRGLLRIGKPDPAPKGLYMFGSVGRGKSMLMDLFFEGVGLPLKRRVHFHAFMVQVHAAIHQHRQKVKRGEDVPDDPIGPVADQITASATLLCFDEFQVNDVADAMILGRLFDRLFVSGVVIVLTSNTAPDDLYLGGINRPLFLPFIEVLKERVDIHHLDGADDHRLNRVLAQPIYHHPLGEEAKKAMDRAWSDITAGLRPIETEIKVKGRTTKVPLSTNTAARFDFSELCGAALGAEDFLAIAQRYPTILLENIPILAAERRDESRRLIVLVDAIYEAGGLIIISADAEAENLVPKGREAAAFARTASRLHEMRSASYLERFT